MRAGLPPTHFLTIHGPSTMVGMNLRRWLRYSSSPSTNLRQRRSAGARPRSPPPSPPTQTQYFQPARPLHPSDAMATRGVKQLQKLTLVYCEHGGSSRTLREYVASGRVVDFARANPSVEVEVAVRNGRHPHVAAEYRSGWAKQVCVKNEGMGRIGRVMSMLRDSSGRKMAARLGGPVRTQTPSVQGIWTPFLHLGETEFRVEMR